MDAPIMIVLSTSKKAAAVGSGGTARAASTSAAAAAAEPARTARASRLSRDISLLRRGTTFLPAGRLGRLHLASELRAWLVIFAAARPGGRLAFPAGSATRPR